MIRASVAVLVIWPNPALRLIPRTLKLGWFKALKNWRGTVWCGVR
jgi:hypothetical protein